MTIYRRAGRSLERVNQTTFADEGLLERRDLQRLVRADISVLGDDLMVVAEEFGEWEDSSRRIDLLCLDTEGTLVVVELKRTTDGGHMELQALRYAAMVSNMTYSELVATHARFLGGDDSKERAAGAIRQFLDFGPEEEPELNHDVRIILASADFSKELTTSVLWLNRQGLDITCIRMVPYRLNAEVLVDVQQIVPLPEAEDYETRIRAKEAEGQRTEAARHGIFRRFWAQLIDRSKGRTQLLANRSTTAEHWLSAGIGRSGFTLNFVLRKEECRVECFIDLGKGNDERNLATLRALEMQRGEIEGAYGKPLDWQELPESRACRICDTMPGGWKTPEAEWPELQNRLIDAMVRLEGALREPIRNLSIGE